MVGVIGECFAAFEKLPLISENVLVCPGAGLGSGRTPKRNRLGPLEADRNSVGLNVDPLDSRARLARPKAYPVENPGQEPFQRRGRN